MTVLIKYRDIVNTLLLIAATCAVQPKNNALIIINCHIKLIIAFF